MSKKVLSIVLLAICLWCLIAVPADDSQNWLVVLIATKVVAIASGYGFTKLQKENEYI